MLCKLDYWLWCLDSQLCYLDAYCLTEVVIYGYFFWCRISNFGVKRHPWVKGSMSSNSSGHILSFPITTLDFWRLPLKAVLGSTYVVKQLSFSMIPSILTFTFYLILRSFLAFLGPIGLFWKSEVRDRLNNFFGFYSCSWATFIFYVSFNSDFWFCLKFGVIFGFLGV